MYLTVVEIDLYPTWKPIIYCYPCYHVYARYLQLYTWNKPCFKGI